MPANRVPVRRSSRQTSRAPSQPPSGATPAAGSSSRATLHPVAEESGPARKKQAVGRVAPRPRAQPKAPAPPRTTSHEVIEISSDDEDHRPRKQTKRVTPESSARVRELEQLVNAFEEHVICDICTCKMWNPFIVSCGHTFCRECLQDWFSTSLAKHLVNHPEYDAASLAPNNYLAALAQPDLHAQTRATLQRHLIDIHTRTAHPEYSCPKCRIIVRSPPAENFVVKHIVRSLAAMQGEENPKPDQIARYPHSAQDGPFDGFFSKFRCG
ncbi:uncharacterized protein BXZ73DRAFT_88709 [Epithele typhae]|uniref:uncharacterized protein n=1 Tax=Epithele typhae TaxID=378194 RepID=UPI0020087E84|nr:uncharacterized protein BXZ73DRAFT_88709 [Epithele typhae]KAH9940478.1 hypothetical protein BXZ73DRAFT_88709 [Epithele typhae]